MLSSSLVIWGTPWELAGGPRMPSPAKISVSSKVIASFLSTIVLLLPIIDVTFNDRVLFCLNLLLSEGMLHPLDEVLSF